MPSPVDCLIFDLFGVLVSFDDGLVYARLAAHCENPAIAEQEMRDLVSLPDLTCGRLTLAALRSELVAKHGLNLSLDDFIATWMVSYSEPMPGMRELLRQASGRCKLVLLSNVDPFYWPTVLESLPELRNFDALSLSFEQGVAKPDPRAFERAIDLSRSGADSCFFVDDKLENIHAAAQYGLRGHHFTSTAVLRRTLKTIGVPL